MVLRILSILFLATSVVLGQQGAQAVLQKGDQLELTSRQRDQISTILSDTGKEYNRVRVEEKNSPALKEKLTAMRQGAQDKALALLSPSQRQKWKELTGSGVVSSGQGSVKKSNYSGQLHHAESHGLRQALKNCFSSSRRRRAIRREHRAREASRQASPGGFAIASVRWR